MENQIKILEEKLLPLGFVKNNGEFTNNNLLIYYRNSHKEWRLKDTSIITSMDVCSISFPLDDNEISQIWRYCSSLYKNE